MREKMLPFAVEQGRRMMITPRGCLKYPFLDPSGPYVANLWDWDSYWAAVSLFEIANEAGDKEFAQQVSCHAAGSLMNLLEVQGEDGSLPVMMRENVPDNFDNLNNPQSNMAKPLQGIFLQLLHNNSVVTDNEAVGVLKKLRAASECRLSRYKHTKTGLLLWANDIAIGVDDDPTVWGRPGFSSAHIYLNSFFAMDLKAAGDLALKLNDTENSRFFLAEYEKSVEAINTYLWDKRDQWYYTCDVLSEQRLQPHPISGMLNVGLDTFWRVMPLRVRHFSGILPLVANIAAPEQAAGVKKYLCDPAEFWSDYGIRSLSQAEDRFYAPEVSRGNPSNWLGPIWIVACYLAYRALKQYGFDREANELTANTLNLLYTDMEQTGVLHEYYSPETGQPINGPGFVSWNLLALCMDKN